MLFSSVVFLFVYLPITLAAYYACFVWSLREGPRAAGWRRASHLLLFVASLFFYVWGEMALVAVMLFSTIVDYGCGLRIDRARGRLAAAASGARPGKAWLIASILTNLSLLGVFKYANFGIENFNALAVAAGLEHLALTDFAGIALPLGISFYTFQSMSYTIDVYRGQVPATRSFVDFACYVTMFPQLVAGPIVRYADVAEQLIRRSLGIELVASGVTRFTIGLAKKVLIANTVAVPADAIFGMEVGQLTAFHAWLGVVCYSLQIYFDFSGYSDMAIGLGRMLGFRYPENFRYPYVARSNQDFWRRWHISLSTWFRDYLYIPLGGNRVGAARNYLNLVLVFFLCGLWHGASWNFVLWGLYHGGFLIAERLGLEGGLRRRPRALQHAYLLLVAMGGWVLFRAETLGQAGAVYAAMAGFGAGDGQALHFLQPHTVAAIAAGLLFATPVAPRIALALARTADAGRRPAGLAAGLSLAVGQPLLVAGLLLVSVMVLSAGTYNPFIYFRF
jgi:alginate O-acetyltransferase complex protein AlgI